MPTSEAWILNEWLRGRMNVPLSSWNNVRSEKLVGAVNVDAASTS